MDPVNRRPRSNDEDSRRQFPQRSQFSSDRRGFSVKQISLINVLVKDQDATIEFYKKLGFVVIEDVPFGPNRWVTVRLPDDKTLSISLNLAESEGDRALVGRQTGSQPLFGLATDDCLGEYRRMKSAGVNFQGEPQVQPYGTGVLLEDLYGNKIYLNQEPS
jgi:catechol 2,3-dioxygenase-like lactoylglutathione lyase family enzyme